MYVTLSAFTLRVDDYIQCGYDCSILDAFSYRQNNFVRFFETRCSLF